MSADVTAALAAVTGALPAAEERPGQRQMAQAVARSRDRTVVLSRDFPNTALRKYLW